MVCVQGAADAAVVGGEFELFEDDFVAVFLELLRAIGFLG